MGDNSQLLMTTTPFGGGTFTGGHVPEPSDQRTRDFDICFFELLKNMCPCNNGVISKKHGITTNKKCSTVQFC